MLMFAPIVQVLHVSLGEETAHAMSADMRLIKSKIICPFVESSAGEEYKPKAGHVFCLLSDQIQ